MCTVKYVELKNTMTPKQKLRNEYLSINLTIGFTSQKSVKIEEVFSGETDE